MKICIGNRWVGDGHEPFVVAEMSGNHNQSIERALAIIDAAASSGAHAVKLQTYTADTMTIDCDRPEYRIADEGSLWAGRTLYELYGAAHTPWEWHAKLFERARERGLLIFSTPFDATAVDFLEALGAPAYKIASFELLDLPLIEKCARTGKPLIMSTGMSTAGEIGDAVAAASRAGSGDVILLKCTSSYPAEPTSSNLKTLPSMRDAFGCLVGLSDHCMGIGVAAASVALGACMVEKHFTLCRADGGVDSSFSLEPDEMAMLVRETKAAWQAIGHVSYGPVEAERRSLAFRRSLIAVRDIPAGKAIDESDIRAIRPGYGLSPKYWPVVLGMRARTKIERGKPIQWEDLG